MAGGSIAPSDLTTSFTPANADAPPDISDLKAAGWGASDTPASSPVTPAPSASGVDAPPDISDLKAAGWGAPTTSAPSPQAGTAPPPAPDVMPDAGPQPDSWAKDIQEFIYPTKTRKEGGVLDPELETKPDWHQMPELSNYQHDVLPDPHALKVIAGTAIAGPEKVMKIMKAQFPEVDVKRDGDYLLMKSKVDGQTYAWKPGFRKESDIGRGLLGTLEFMGGSKLLSGAMGGVGKTASYFLPSAAATTAPAATVAAQAVPTLKNALTGIAGGIGHAAAGAAAAEGAGYAAGGDFSKSSVALQGLLGGVFPTAGAAIGGLRSLVNGGAASAGADLGQVLGQAAREAPGGWNQGEYASRLGQNMKVLNAGKYFGTEITPDMAATNKAALTLNQRVLSSAGQHEVNDAAVRSAGNAVKSVYEKLGATFDNSMTNKETADAVNKLHEALQKTSDDLYTDLVPGHTPVPPAARTDLDNFINTYPGGPDKLPKFLKRVQSALSEKPPTAGTTQTVMDPATLKTSTVQTGGSPGEPLVYQTVDDLAKEAGRATRGSGSWKDPDSGLAKFVYQKLNAIRDATAQSIGKDATAARAALQVTKDFETDIEDLLGRQLKGAVAATGDAIPATEAALKAAAKGNAAALVRTSEAISKLPETVRQRLMASALVNTFRGATEDQPISFAKAKEVLGNLLQNKEAYPVVMKNLDPEARRAIPQLYNLAKGVKAMTDARQSTGLATDAYRQLAMADAVAGKVADFIEGGSKMVGATLGGAVGTAVGHSAGTEAALIGGGEGMAAGRFLGGGLGKLITIGLRKGTKDIIPATANMLNSPEFASLVRNSGGANGVTPSALRRFVNYPPFVGLANRMQIAPSERGAFVERLARTAMRSAGQTAAQSAADRTKPEAQ